MPVKLTYTPASQNSGQADMQSVVLFPRDKTTETMRYLHNNQGLTVMGTGKTECVGPVSAWRLSVSDEDETGDGEGKETGTIPVDKNDLICLRIALDFFDFESQPSEEIKEAHRGLSKKVARLLETVTK